MYKQDYNSYIVCCGCKHPDIKAERVEIQYNRKVCHCPLPSATSPPYQSSIAAGPYTPFMSFIMSVINRSKYFDYFLDFSPLFDFSQYRLTGQFIDMGIGNKDR